jgi:hypothetical protein
MIPSTQSSKPFSIEYPSSTVKRAKRALYCSPFELSLFTQMRTQSVPLAKIAGRNGVGQGYTQRLLSEQQIEGELMWLISVGLLRREVDGQGITDSFRLTPLGRQIVEQVAAQGNALLQPTGWERIANRFTRWLRLW